MNIRQLEAYRAVMIARSVVGAAELLEMSQPAVTRLLQKLESDLNLALFDRRSGRLVPTQEGILLYEEVEKAFVSVDRISEIARDLKSLDVGTLTIAALPLLALDFIPEVVAEFSKMHPTVKVTIHMQMSSKVEEWAAAQLIDFGIADFPFERSTFERPGIQADEFCSTPYMVALPADHPLATRNALTSEDLEGERFVDLASTTVGRHIMDKLFGRTGVRRNVIAETNIVALNAKLIAARVGLGFIDPFTAESAAVRDLVLIPFRPAIPMRLALLHPVHRPLTLVAKEFIALLKMRRNDLVAHWTARHNSQI